MSARTVGQKTPGKIQGEEDNSMKKEAKGYIGNISNAGSQVVKAPHLAEVKKGKTVKKTGTDLRGGK